MTIDNADRAWEYQRLKLLNDAAISMSEVLTNLVPNYDSDDPHMMETPERFVKMLQELTTPEPFKFTIFDSDRDEMICSLGIPFYTFCAHHILPFYGVAHVAYLPAGKMVGVSKLARTVEFYSRSLNVQEDLTANIADRIEAELDPIGVGVIMKAEHLCQTMRGIKAQGAKMVTSAMRGAFLDPNKLARAEFLSIIRESHG